MPPRTEMSVTFKMRISHLRPTLGRMNTRTTVAAAFIAVLVQGCASPTASPSSSPTPEPSVSPSVTDTPSPTATPEPVPVINAGPLTVAGEVTFGPTDFGGMPYGQAATAYAPNITPAVHESACGDIYTSPMLFADTPSTPPWGLFLITNWNDPAVTPGAATVQAFLLVVQSDSLPTAPMGPVGPRGLRLGTPTATIETMFPAEAAVTTQRVTTVLDFATDSELAISERMFSVADVDGGPMIIGTVGDNVSTIMWGNPAYVYAQRGILRCTT
jgi:hypothetical protein